MSEKYLFKISDHLLQTKGVRQNYFNALLVIIFKTGSHAQTVDKKKH